MILSTLKTVSNDASCQARRRLACSIKRPIPVCVMPRPPKICTASLAVSCAHRVLYIFRKAIWPARLVAWSLYDWNIKVCHSRRVGWHSKALSQHIAHLIRDILEPGLNGFCARDHRSQFRADDGLRAERLAERLALRDPFQAFLDDHPLCASGCANHHPTLVVEVT